MAGVLRLLARRPGGEVAAQAARSARQRNRSANPASARDLPSLLGLPSPGGAGSLGVLVPLRCGHNAAYSASEQRMLKHHVDAAMATWRDAEGSQA